MNLEDRLNEISDFAAHTVEFGSYTKEEKEASHNNLPYE